MSRTDPRPKTDLCQKSIWHVIVLDRGMKNTNSLNLPIWSRRRDKIHQSLGVFAFNPWSSGADMNRPEIVL